MLMAGCISPPGQTNPISFTWSCVNSTSAMVNYHEGSTCSGPIVHAAPLTIDTQCSASASGGSSHTMCAFGDYHPSPDTINVNVFTNAKNTCPVSPGLRPSGIVEFQYEHCFADSTSSYWYTCTPTAVTGVAFESKDCSGTPQHLTQVAPLGCFANASNPTGAPQFTACPNRRSAGTVGVVAAQLRGATLISVPRVHGLSASMDDAIATQTERARELVASSTRG